MNTYNVFNGIPSQLLDIFRKMVKKISNLLIVNFEISTVMKRLDRVISVVFHYTYFIINLHSDFNYNVDDRRAIVKTLNC